MKSVLITGAGGFLGNQLVNALLRRGYSVHATIRKIHPTIEHSNLSLYSVDLLDHRATSDLISIIRPECLIHLAWESQHGSYWHSSENLSWLAASLNIAKEFSNASGQRAIFAGSSAEYLWGGLGYLHETISTIAPHSLYGTSKNALRQVLELWAPQANVSWAWARFFNVFGPGENAARLLPRIASQLLAGKDIPFDNGTINRDFLYINDACDALVSLFESTVQGPVNIASGRPQTVRSVLTSMEEFFGTPGQLQFGQIPDVMEHPPFVVADTTRLNQEVGWSTLDTFQSRLQTACEWWRTVAISHSTT
jgi:nucleoside-diphosphate-sugar epimerase